MTGTAAEAGAPTSWVGRLDLVYSKLENVLNLAAAVAIFALMIIGAVTNNVAVYQGGSSVMMTSYVPMMAAPSFYLGLILFAVGALIACFVFLGTLVVAKREKTYQGSVPLVTFGAITACIIAVFTITSGAAAATASPTDAASNPSITTPSAPSRSSSPPRHSPPS